MSMVKVSVGVGSVLAAAFVMGFAVETTSLSDEFWSEGALIAIVPLVLFLTAALAASVDEKVAFVSAVVLGLVAGYLTVIIFILGVVSPYALELGGRELSDLEGALDWVVALTLGLIIWGGGGAVLGAASGTAAWALCFGLGLVRSHRE